MGPGNGPSILDCRIDKKNGPCRAIIILLLRPINTVDFKPSRPFRIVTGSEDNTAAGTVMCTMYLYYVPCTMHHCTMHHCTMYSVLCTVYYVQCTTREYFTKNLN